MIPGSGQRPDHDVVRIRPHIQRGDDGVERGIDDRHGGIRVVDDIGTTPGGIERYGAGTAADRDAPNDRVRSGVDDREIGGAAVRHINAGATWIDGDAHWSGADADGGLDIEPCGVEHGNLAVLMIR